MINFLQIFGYYLYMGDLNKFERNSKRNSSKINIKK